MNTELLRSLVITKEERNEILNEVRRRGSAFVSAKKQRDEMSIEHLWTVWSKNRPGADGYMLLDQIATYLNALYPGGANAITSPKFTIGYNIYCDINRVNVMGENTMGVRAGVTWSRKPLNIKMRPGRMDIVPIAPEVRMMIRDNKLNRSELAKVSDLNYTDVKDMRAETHDQVLSVIKLAVGGQQKLTRVLKGVLMYYDSLSLEKDIEVSKNIDSITFEIGSIVKHNSRSKVAYVYCDTPSSAPQVLVNYMMCEKYPNDLIPSTNTHLSIPQDADDVFLVSSGVFTGKVSCKLNSGLIWGSIINYCRSMGCLNLVEQALVIAATMIENRFLSTISLPTVVSYVDLVRPFLCPIPIRTSSKPIVGIKSMQLCGRLHQLSILNSTKDVIIACQTSTRRGGDWMRAVQIEFKSKENTFGTMGEANSSLGLLRYSNSMDWWSHLSVDDLKDISKVSAFESLWLCNTSKEGLYGGMFEGIIVGQKNRMNGMTDRTVRVNPYRILMNELNKSGIVLDGTLAEGDYTLDAPFIRCEQEEIFEEEFFEEDFEFVDDHWSPEGGDALDDFVEPPGASDFVDYHDALDEPITRTVSDIDNAVKAEEARLEIEKDKLAKERAFLESEIRRINEEKELVYKMKMEQKEANRIINFEKERMMNERKLREEKEKEGESEKAKGKEKMKEAKQRKEVTEENNEDLDKEVDDRNDDKKSKEKDEKKRTKEVERPKGLMAKLARAVSSNKGPKSPKHNHLEELVSKCREGPSCVDLSVSDALFVMTRLCSRAIETDVGEVVLATADSGLNKGTVNWIALCVNEKIDARLSEHKLINDIKKRLLLEMYSMNDTNSLAMRIVPGKADWCTKLKQLVEKKEKDGSLSNTDLVLYYQERYKRSIEGLRGYYKYIVNCTPLIRWYSRMPGTQTGRGRERVARIMDNSQYKDLDSIVKLRNFEFENKVKFRDSILDDRDIDELLESLSADKIVSKLIQQTGSSLDSKVVRDPVRLRILEESLVSGRWLCAPFKYRLIRGLNGYTLPPEMFKKYMKMTSRLNTSGRVMIGHGNDDEDDAEIIDDEGVDFFKHQLLVDSGAVIAWYRNN